jgi:hypothetical protein
LRLGFYGYRYNEGAASLSSVGADIHNPLFEKTLRHLCRLHDCQSMMCFDTIHSFGLGHCKRIIDHCVTLVKHYGLCPPGTPSRKRAKVRDNLIKELDSRMKSDEFTFMVSAVSGNNVRKVSKTLRAFTNLTAKEYQFAAQKLLFALGSGEGGCSLLPEFIAAPVRKVLMMISDFLLIASMGSWNDQVFKQVSN